MSYRIAVASSDDVHIDLHFGGAREFTIFEVNDGGTYQVLEKREIPAYDNDNTDKNKILSRNTAPSGNSCGVKSGCSSECKPEGGCGSGHSDSDIETKVNALSDCRCLLCRKVGPGAERQLERKAITTFQVDLLIGEALDKIVDYYNKIDHHISLRKR
jgi:predicted Fe-Mo cluster-binding NifX family protein